MSWKLKLDLAYVIMTSQSFELDGDSCFSIFLHADISKRRLQAFKGSIIVPFHLPTQIIETMGGGGDKIPGK